MTCLVTGAAGKLGSAVERVLVESGVEVRATDRVRNPGALAPFVHADLLDSGSLPGLVSQVDSVVHCAALPTEHHEASEILRSNVQATLNLCLASKTAGITKFVYISSAQVFASQGKPEEESPEVPYLPLDGDCPMDPRNLYAFSKATGEILVRDLLSTSGVQCQSLRFPWLVEGREDRPWGRRLKPIQQQEARAVVEQGFACLSFRDAALLVLACLRTDLPGYRTYYPAFSVVPPERVGEYLERYYPEATIRVPPERLASLIDLSAVTDATGWLPMDRPPQPEATSDPSWLRGLIKRWI